jgi:hypothetical protein
MKRRIGAFILLFAFLILFSSCEKEKKTCEELLIAGLNYGIDGYTDNGYIFLKNAEEGSTFFISQNTSATMYGEKFCDVLSSTCDFAIYVSAPIPYEVAVFECYSKNDADEILQMCYERADEIKVGLRYSEWENASKFIETVILGRYVIFVFTESQARNIGVIEEIKLLLN